MPTNKSTAKRLLCIWLTNWPIQRLRQQLIADIARNSLAEQTNQGLIIWRTDPRHGRLVVARCHLAAKLGVRVGMPIAQASEIVSKGAERLLAEARNRSRQGQPNSDSPSNQQLADSFLPSVHQHDPELDEQSLLLVADLIQQKISPQVAIEPLEKKRWADQALHQPESLLCDISGATHLFGDEADLLKATQQQLASLNLTARLAVADTVGAAWALAHYANQSSSDDLAYSGSPAAPYFIAAPGAIKQSIEKLPVQSLRIPPQTVATLGRLGVQRIGQLLRLPRSGLATRLGQPLVHRMSQLLGEADEPLNMHQPPAQYAYQLDLEYPTNDERILANRIEKLTEQLKDGLAAHHRGALRITCCLVPMDHPPLSFDIGLFAPTQDDKQLACLLVSCLQSRRLPGPVAGISIEVTLSQKMQSSQSSLFSSENGSTSIADGNSSLPRLINSLSGRLGRESVLSISRTDNPLPEKAFQLSPMTGQAQNSSKRMRRSSRPSHAVVHPSPSDAMRRPLELLSPPLPLSVPKSFDASFDAHPVSVGPPVPQVFRLGGMIHRVVRYWGPERVETGWWDGVSTRRDYFRVETDQGHWWWIFRMLGEDVARKGKHHSKGNRWMLHGRFS